MASREQLLPGEDDQSVYRKLLLSHGITRLATQGWLFIAPLVLLRFTPGQLLGPAFWGLCTTLGTSLLSPPLGAWADRSCRKTTVTLGVAAQAVAVLGATAVLLLSKVEGSDWGALLAFSGFSVLEKLGAALSDVSVKREWAPRLFEGDMLKRTNSMMSQIDLASETVGPFIAGLLIMPSLHLPGLPPERAGFVMVGLLNAASFLPQLRLLLQIFAAREAKLQPLRAEEVQRKANPLVLKGGAWTAWLHHPSGIQFLGLSYSLLYLTVLSPHGAFLTAHLAQQGVPSWQLSLLRGAGALLGVLGVMAHSSASVRLGRCGDGLFVLWLAGMTLLALSAYHQVEGRGLTWPLLIFMSAVCLARPGLYGFELGVLNTEQELADARHRSAIGSVDTALTSFATLAMYGSGLLLGRFAARMYQTIGSDASKDLMSRAFCACLLPVSLALPAVPGAADPRCPEAACCEDKANFHCWGHGLWTFAYCCARDGAEDCYRWGEDSVGQDLAVAEAVSGVQCRHLCQASAECGYWTYLVHAPELSSELRGRCFLKSAAAVSKAQKAHPFVVSGERLCRFFAEGLSPAEAAGRQGLAGAWKTTTEAAGSGSDGLLPGSGTAGWFLEASKALEEQGFVVILDALKERAEVQQVAQEVADRMLRQDPDRLGNRGPRRYSFGGASRTLHMMHLPGWERLLDNAAVHFLLATYYEEGAFLACGGGGDFVLPGTSTFQSLHLDVGGPVHSLHKAPAVGVNFVLEDLSCADAPLRVVPFSHRNTSEPPDLSREPWDMKSSVLCPLPAGAAIVRDLRLWHGGTPSAAAKPRLLPNAEFVSLQWGALTCGSGEILDPCQPVLPAAAHRKLSPFGQEISRRLVDASGRLEHLAAGGWMIEDFRGYHRHKQEAY
ncbi:unnamed protein product [Effrenium voratum]|uniref:Apple domain-containing protein n=1 Tax=Effrenium voratum TaxID=2562239 RepID=A0AA36IMH7_9DINO|nr:unnamed protein product [Effrenium voratum]